MLVVSRKKLPSIRMIWQLSAQIPGSTSSAALNDVVTGHKPQCDPCAMRDCYTVETVIAAAAAAACCSVQGLNEWHMHYQPNQLRQARAAMLHDHRV
jgi:hypothetical protein